MRAQLKSSEQTDVISMEPILRLSGLSKSYGALIVVDDLDLHLDQDSALGIIGPNGAGKTTLFNLVTGSVRPDKGMIELEGKDITNLSLTARCHKGVARSFQIPQPFSGMTVFENLLVGAFFGAGSSRSEAEEETFDILYQTGLIDKANTYASSLTLLERKRLELARALSARPKLLLLDEIAGGLTEQECLLLIRTIEDIRKKGITIIWIEHIVHVLLAVVDRLMVMDFGQKIADGDPKSVITSEDVREIYLGVETDD